MVVSETLRRLRKARGLRLIDVAIYTGISVSHISDVERGVSSISLEMLALLAQMYGVTSGAIVDGIAE
jgi:transcriptional regulator with XRE-family HTH domain